MSDVHIAHKVWAKSDKSYLLEIVLLEGDVDNSQFEDCVLIYWGGNVCLSNSRIDRCLVLRRNQFGGLELMEFNQPEINDAMRRGEAGWSEEKIAFLEERAGGKLTPYLTKDTPHG